MAKLPRPSGSLPETEEELDKTDPDVFKRHDPGLSVSGSGAYPAYSGQDSDTVPRCTQCGQAQERPTSFDQGVIYALQGVRWMLRKHPVLTKADADTLVLWLKAGIVGSRP